MLAELSMFVRQQGGFPLAPDLNVSQTCVVQSLLVLPDLLGPYKDMNTFIAGSVKYTVMLLKITAKESAD